MLESFKKILFHGCYTLSFFYVLFFIFDKFYYQKSSDKTNVIVSIDQNSTFDKNRYNSYCKQI